MRLLDLTCPSCGALLEVEDGIETYTCEYCGHKIMLADQSDAAYESKTKIKSMEHAERMAAQKYAHERYEKENKAKKDKRDLLLPFLLFGLAMLLFFGCSFMERHESNKEEKKLQALVEEIQVDIDNEDFNTAYIKAQSIKCTDAYSDEIEEKWDNIRKELINQIIEAETAATGSSKHEPEKDGWFD